MSIEDVHRESNIVMHPGFKKHTLILAYKRLNFRMSGMTINLSRYLHRSINHLNTQAKGSMRMIKLRSYLLVDKLKATRRNHLRFSLSRQT